MERSRDGLIWGAILLIVGIGFLLWNFDVFAEFQGTAELLVAGFFALVGLGFLVSYLMTRADWWKVIPGFALLAVGGIIFMSSRQAPPEWIGGMLFLGLALAFAVIYFGNRQERWWALIPFGTMLVMIALLVLSTLGLSEGLLGAVLFGGMGLVFLLIYLLATERAAFVWALIPAAVLLVMGLVTLAAAIIQTSPNLEQTVRLWPVLLVIVGVFLLGLSLRTFSRPDEQPVTLPAEPAPSEAPAAPGTAVLEMDQDYAPSAKAPVERAPVELVESPAGEPESVGQEPEEDRSGEVDDLYQFLRSAPPAPDEPSTS